MEEELPCMTTINLILKKTIVFIQKEVKQIMILLFIPKMIIIGKKTG